MLESLAVLAVSETMLWLRLWFSGQGGGVPGVSISIVTQARSAEGSVHGRQKIHVEFHMDGAVRFTA